MSSSFSSFVLRRGVALCCGYVSIGSTHPTSAQCICRAGFGFPLWSLFTWSDYCSFPGPPLRGRIGSWLAVVCQPWRKQSATGHWGLPHSAWVVHFHMQMTDWLYSFCWKSRNTSILVKGSGSQSVCYDPCQGMLVGKIWGVEGRNGAKGIRTNWGMSVWEGSRDVARKAKG